MSEETIDFTDNSWKNVCARQYRHNSDNSPSISHPKDGFVIAYDKKETDLIVAHLQSTISQLQEANKELLSALSFYGNPENYIGIGFFPDKPCGDFIDDFSECLWIEEEYGIDPIRPGKRAREAISKYGSE